MVTCDLGMFYNKVKSTKDIIPFQSVLRKLNNRKLTLKDLNMFGIVA